MRSIGNLKRYVIKPSLKTLAVLEVTGEQHGEIANETKKDEEGNTFKVIQTIEGFVITTKVTTIYKLKDGTKMNEKSTLKMEVNKGQKLVYIDNKGFVLPELNICTVEEAIEDYSVLKED